MSPPTSSFRSVTSIPTPADFGLRAEFYDTATTGVVPDASGRNHIPLGLRIANRSHVRYNAGHNKAVVYDMVITNISRNDISDGYIGFFLDADIMYESTYGYEDDMIGSLRSSGIAYVVDNDGDPQSGDFTGRSPTRLFAFQFLGSSFTARDTSFNWWRVYTLGGADDFGPRRRDTVYHDYGTGGTGEPYGDQNKYHMLRFPEWDYDQWYITDMGTDDDIWMAPPAAVALDLYDGGDIRFLMSTGPFDLPADSSIRLLYTMFVGRWVHRDPTILQFLPDYPDLYRMSLNMSDAMATSANARLLAEALIDPMRPPVGFAVTHESIDSVVLSWDPWVLPEVTGYRVYAGGVPFTDFPHPGAIAPWVRPESLMLVDEIGPERRYTITTFSPDTLYYLSVSHKTALGEGERTEPVPARAGTRATAPEFDRSRALYLPGEPAVLTWSHDAPSMFDHFAVYRFEPGDPDTTCFHSYYDTGESLAFRTARDTVVVDGISYYYYQRDSYAEVDGHTFSFADDSPIHGCLYVVAGTDRNGFESWFSRPARAVERPAVTADIGVLTYSSPYGQGVALETVTSFYDDVLSRYSYEICNLSLPENQITDSLWWRELLRYRCVIIDDGLRDYALNMLAPSAIHDLLDAGGSVIYCGSFFGKTGADWFGAAPAYRSVDSAMQRLFGVDSVFQTGLRWYATNTDPPLIDSMLGFVRAVPQKASLPFLQYDSLPYPLLGGMEGYWPTTSAAMASAFGVSGSSVVVFAFESQYPVTSRVHGHPCAVLKEHKQGRAMAIAEHLWYLDTDGVRSLVDWFMRGVPTGSEDPDEPPLPSSVELHQNYPNPFNPTTTLRFSVVSAGHVRLDIYNVLGQRVKTLVDTYRPAGMHTVVWDGTTESGNRAASGVYLYRLRTDGTDASRKMLLLR